MVPQPKPQPLPGALLDAELVFVRDDALKPPLSPLYRGPYRVLDGRRNLLFSRSEINQTQFLWKLKPVISSVPVVPAVSRL